MPQVELTRHLYQFFPALEGQALDVEGATVGEVVAAMDRLAPGFAFYVCDELGRVRQHVNIFIGRDRIRDRATLTDPVDPGARVSIIQALSGG